MGEAQSLLLTGPTGLEGSTPPPTVWVPGLHQPGARTSQATARQVGSSALCSLSQVSLMLGALSLACRPVYWSSLMLARNS